MVRAQDVLDKAKDLIFGARMDQWGDPRQSFGAIGSYWTEYLFSRGLLPQGKMLDARDVALMLVLLKVHRASCCQEIDSLVDAAGYAALAHQVSG